MLVRMRVAEPVFVSMTWFPTVVLPTAVLAKVTDVVERLSAGTPVPEPVMLTVCVEGEALSESVMLAGRLPADLGLNVIERAQELLTAMDAPQVLDIV
jgi:hypothetical protein